MFEEPTVPTFELPSKLPEIALEVSSEAAIEVVESSTEVRSKSAKELADEYGVSDRTVQSWFKTITTAYAWIEPESLKTGKSAKTRYTPLCQALIAEYRASTSTLSEEDWIASVHAVNPEKLATAVPSAPAVSDDIPVSPTEVMPPVDRTAAGSLIPTGSSYLSALAAEELELEQLEAQELELLGRMQNNLERLNQNQTQWQRTNDLRRQRLLRQTRLEAATLATELEAEFDETLRESQYNIRQSTVGKPPAATPRSS